MRRNLLFAKILFLLALLTLLSGTAKAKNPVRLNIPSQPNFSHCNEFDAICLHSEMLSSMAKGSSFRDKLIGLSEKSEAECHDFVCSASLLQKGFGLIVGGFKQKIKNGLNPRVPGPTGKKKTLCTTYNGDETCLEFRENVIINKFKGEERIIHSSINDQTFRRMMMTKNGYWAALVSNWLHVGYNGSSESYDMGNNGKDHSLTIDSKGNWVAIHDDNIMAGKNLKSTFSTVVDGYIKKSKILIHGGKNKLWLAKVTDTNDKVYVFSGPIED